MARRIDPNYLTNGITGVQIPKLPGYRVPVARQRYYGKKQLFTGSSDGVVDPGMGRQRPASALPGSRRNNAAAEARMRPASAALRRPQSAAATAPDWLANDRQVLRFYGYFVEDANQSPYESQRIRKIILYYYLADFSMHVAEPKVANSGMPSGVFIKRARIARPDGQLFKPEDFTVGGSIQCRSRLFHLVDADKSTREHYKEQFFQDLRPAMGYPEDAHMKLQKEMNNMQRRSDESRSRKPDSRRQFMEFDGKVLRFSCFWDDTKKLYGEKRKFILHYFLASDTIEVREVLQPNSGRDPFPLLLKRSVLPSRSRPGEIVKPLDLMCGKYVHVYSRDLLMVDCDQFTREFYRDYFGVEQRPVPGFEPKPRAMGRASEPPPTGFGSEEDSLQSHYSLNPKAPKKDMKKAQRMDRKVLRFRAKLVSPPIQDIPRRFVIACYLVDDTVSIFEPPQRNSGIIGGKFLERGRFRHMEPPEGGPPRFFKPGDFYVGAVIPLEFCPHQQLEILEADSFTLKYCEGACKQFCKSDISEVNKSLARALSRRSNVVLRDFFMDRDPQDNGYIKGSELQQALKDMNVFNDLHLQERITLSRRYDDHNNGTFAYHEMCDDISRAYTQLNPTQARDVVESAFIKLRLSPTSLRKVFRRVDKGNGLLELNEFLDLLDFYQIEVTEREAKAAFGEFDRDNSGHVDYNEMCDAIYPTAYHGSSVPVDDGAAAGHSGNSYGNFAKPSGGGGGGRTAGGGFGAIKAIVSKIFDGKKYELHKQFRKRDRQQSGTIDEDDFIEALAACSPNISDDDKFELALHYFPNAGDQLEYKEWITKMVR